MNTECAHVIPPGSVLGHSLGRNGQIVRSLVYILDTDNEQWRDGEGVGYDLGAANLKERKEEACKDYDGYIDSNIEIGTVANR